MKYYNDKARQAGMTLIELTVVLLVLIGLAGLMIPYVGGFVEKTHDSSGADNIGNVAKAIAQYDVQFAGYPQGFDSLIIGNGTGAVNPYMMQTNVVTAAPLNQVNAQSLWRAGITGLNGMCDGDGTIGAADADGCQTGFNPTFNANDASGDLAFTMSGTVAVGGAAAAAPTTEALAFVSPDEATATADGVGNPTLNNVEHICGIQNAAADADADGTVDNKYVLLGIGQNSSMVGRTMQDAPVHFAQVGAMNANSRYNRFVAIFKVDNDNTVGRNGSADNAKFVCAGMAMSTLEGQQAAIQRYYDNTDNNG